MVQGGALRHITCLKGTSLPGHSAWLGDTPWGQDLVLEGDPSTFSEGDWRHSYVGFEGPSTF